MLKKKNNVILIGFMGCGKTSIGRRIASNYSMEFVDTDIAIQELSGLSINEIFAKYGEDYFCRLERNYCKLSALSRGYVIATGGGIIKNEINVDNLKINGVVTYLKCSPEKIYNNIKNDNSRPLLSGTSDKYALICKLLKEREHLYKKYADITIDVSDMRLEESAWQVGRELRRFCYI